MMQPQPVTWSQPGPGLPPAAPPPVKPDVNSALGASIHAMLGKDQTRPPGEYRNAQELIKSSPLLANLGNQGGVRDMLKKQVGDFDKDADAAFRAIQVLEYIEKYDAAGKPTLRSKDYNEAGNGKVDGFTKGNEARPNTEAGRLQDFGKYGYAHLKPPADHVARPPAPPPPPPPLPSDTPLPLLGQSRPEGNTDSAAQIIKSEPLLANLGNQSGVRDALKKQVGDFDRDPDAAYRAVQVLRHIEAFDENGKPAAGKKDRNEKGNGKVDGFTRSGEAHHGSEAGRLQDFGKYGYGTLKGLEGRSFEEKLTGLDLEAAQKAIKDAGGDASKLGPDFFTTGKTQASGADKLAALLKLGELLEKYTAGSEAFKSDSLNPEKYTGKGLSPGQQRDAFVKDVQAKIDKLSDDKDVQKFMNKDVHDAVLKRVHDDPNLKAELERRLEASTSQRALEVAFSKTGADGKPVSTTDALAAFIGEPSRYAQALGLPPNFNETLKNAPPAIKERIEKGYEDVASGAELQRLIAGGMAPDKAVIASAVSKAVYETVMDPEATKQGSLRFEEAVTKLARDDLTKNITVEDLYKGLGVDGPDDPALAALIDKHLDSVTPPGQERPKTVEIITGIRAVTDAMRSGMKYDDAMARFAGKGVPTTMPQVVNDTFRTGVMHGVSSVLLAGAIGARYATGAPTSTGITVSQSLLAAGLLTEGAGKFVGDQMDRFHKQNPLGSTWKLPNPAMDVEAVGKFIGAIVGNALGVVMFGIGAHQADKAGDRLGAGFQGSFAGLSGLAAAAGTAEVLTYVANRVLSLPKEVGLAAVRMSGFFGGVAAVVGGVAAIASLIYTIVSMAVEGEKQEKARNAWYDGLEKDFAAFGLKIPDKYTSTAPSNEDIDNLIPLTMGGGAA